MFYFYDNFYFKIYESNFIINKINLQQDHFSNYKTFQTLSIFLLQLLHTTSTQYFSHFLTTILRILLSHLLMATSFFSVFRSWHIGLNFDIIGSLSYRHSGSLFSRLLYQLSYFSRSTLFFFS